MPCLHVALEGKLRVGSSQLVPTYTRCARQRVPSRQLAATCSTSAASDGCSSSNQPPIALTRREALAATMAASASLTLSRSNPSLAAAPPAVDGKQRNLPIDQLKAIVEEDFSRRQYYVTGQLTPSVYADDCQFKDPTTNVKGVKPYTTAVAKLFDPAVSRADLMSLEVQDPHTLLLNWRLEAALKVPGSPKIKPYTGHTRYVTNSEGLIQRHLEDWDISALDAFVSVLFPSFGAPPAPPVQH